MTKEFVRLPEFEKQCKHLNLLEDDVMEIENILLDNPSTGKIIEGSGGVRKLRFALSGKGKSGGARIIYIDFAHYERIYFLFAYDKGEVEDLTEPQKKAMKSVVKLLENEEKRRRKSNG